METKNQQNRKRYQIQASILFRSINKSRKYLFQQTYKHYQGSQSFGFVELETLIWISTLSIITLSTIKVNQEIHQKNQAQIEEFNREWK